MAHGHGIAIPAIHVRSPRIAFVPLVTRPASGNRPLSRPEAGPPGQLAANSLTGRAQAEGTPPVEELSNHYVWKRYYTIFLIHGLRVREDGGGAPM